MGYGEYDLRAHEAATKARAERLPEQIFAQGQCHPTMNPYGVKVRESRDSAQHPDSVGVIFALDVSGSMGEIPVQLATKTLPSFMEGVSTVLPDAQVMFMAVGNGHTDRAPLQVGQFESEASRIDQWLERMYLEGQGGGLCESYCLAMHFAARHTAMDCLEKRGRKGYLFITGDEPPFAWLAPDVLAKVVGDTIPEKVLIHEMITEVSRSFYTFFLIPDRARADQHETGIIWSRLLHERAVVLDTPEDTALACALLVGVQEGALRSAAAIEKHASERHGRTGEARDRVVRAVLPFVEAIARGPIAPPDVLGTRVVTGVKG